MTKTYKDFEEWLHNEIHPGIALADGKLDDDWPDHECEWLAGLSVEKWFNYADHYASLRVIEALEGLNDAMCSGKADSGLKGQGEAIEGLAVRVPTKDCEAIGNKHDYKTNGECWGCMTPCEHDIDYDSDSAPCCVICGLVPEPNEPEDYTRED